MAFGNDDSVFGVVANGLVEDTDFIPQLSNDFQTPELPDLKLLCERVLGGEIATLQATVRVQRLI